MVGELPLRPEAVPRALHRQAGSQPTDRLFREGALYDLFVQDLRQVFVEGVGPDGLVQEVLGFRNFGLPLDALPGNRCVSLWHGLSDDLVPPAMAYQMALRLPNCEAHFVPGGHFVAVEIAGQIVTRLRQLLDAAAARGSA